MKTRGLFMKNGWRKGKAGSIFVLEKFFDMLIVLFAGKAKSVLMRLLDRLSRKRGAS